MRVVSPARCCRGVHSLQCPGIFAATAKPQNGESAMTYYIMAENAKTAGYSPMRYTFEQHQVTLAEINK